MTDPIKIPLLNKKTVTHADLPAAPGIANPAHVNHIANFFKAIGHGIADVFVWAPRVATKTVEVIETSEKLSPEFLSGLKNVMEDVAVIVANGALAATQKGVNVATDYNVLTGIEKLAGDFNAFYPILVKDFNELEGIIVAPTPAVPVPAPVASEVTADLTHGLTPQAEEEINNASSDDTPEQTSPSELQAKFTPKVPVKTTDTTEEKV